MSKNLKKIFLIILVILLTLGCIALGFRTRYLSGIRITQLTSETEKEMMGYVLKSSENRLVIIDGGNKTEVEKLKSIINQNGGIVEYWFITLPEQEHSGALLEILKESAININNICVSLNAAEWYNKYASLNSTEITEFMDELYLGFYRNVVHEVNIKDEFKVDNLLIKVLGIKDENIIQNPSNNQNMIIKVSNNFKSVLFMGDTGYEKSINFKDNNLDEINCSAVQISNHNEDTIATEIYKFINADIYLTPSDKINNEFSFKDQYTKNNKEAEITIW